MSGKFDDKWLDWAIQIEDEVGCDIEAGLDFGQNLGKYLTKTQGCINHEKLMSILQEELGTLLSQEELEVIADATQNCVRERLKEKFHSSEVA